MNMTNGPRPFLRWAGSKRQLLPILSSHWSDDFERYLEPFLGSGSLFFRLGPQRAVLGDINSDLIATYEQVRDNLGEVLLELSGMRKDKGEYYRIRSIDTSSLPPPRRAARFIYLNRFAFNGLYRTNRKGEFNVPYGGEKTGNVPNREWLAACSRALQAASLIAGDFEVVLSQARVGDFVYLDPPYSVGARRVFNEYDPSSFGAHDLQRLRHWLDRLTEYGVEFLMSYAKCQEAELLMDGYTAKKVMVRRNIAGFSGNRRRAGEWLISNREGLAKQEV
jgi:DNA adenine methylase